MLFNNLGFVLVVFGGCLAALMGWLTGGLDRHFHWIWGVCLLVSDLGYRLKWGKSVWRPNGGGWVFLIPVWCCGVLMLFLEVFFPGWAR